MRCTVVLIKQKKAKRSEDATTKDKASSHLLVSFALFYWMDESRCEAGRILGSVLRT